MKPPSKKAYFDDLRSQIDNRGFATVSVLDEVSPYCYTVGLHRSYGHAEIVVFGLPPDLAHGILSDVADRAKEGRPFDLTNPADDLLADGEVIFVRVSKAMYSEYLLSAIKLNEGDFPVYQIVWPSASDGFYPWDEEADEGFIAFQPVLGDIGLRSD